MLTSKSGQKIDGLGILWNRSVAYAVIRQSRLTKESVNDQK